MEISFYNQVEESFRFQKKNKNIFTTSTNYQAAKVNGK